MSRYNLAPFLPDVIVTVGWDNPLQTFFAQVEPADVPEDEDPELLVWVGTMPQAITTVEALQASVADYARIPEHIAAQLRTDEAGKTQPTPLQQWMMDIMSRRQIPPSHI